MSWCYSGASHGGSQQCSGIQCPILAPLWAPGMYIVQDIYAAKHEINIFLNKYFDLYNWKAFLVRSSASLSRCFSCWGLMAHRGKVVFFFFLLLQSLVEELPAAEPCSHPTARSNEKPLFILLSLLNEAFQVPHPNSQDTCLKTEPLWSFPLSLWKSW